MNVPRTARRRLNHWAGEDLFPAGHACTSDGLLGGGGPPTLPAAGEQARQGRARRPKDVDSTVSGEQAAAEAAAAARGARPERGAGVVVGREYPEGAAAAAGAARDDSTGSPRESERRAGGVGVEVLATGARRSRGEEDAAALRRDGGGRRKDDADAARVRGPKPAPSASEAAGGEPRARCECLQNDLKVGLAARQEADGRATRCRKLEREVQQLEKSLGALQEVVSATQRQVSRCRRDLHSAWLRQRQQLRALEQEVKSQESLLKEAALHGKMELRYKCALAELQAGLWWTRDELQRERQASMELLRRHFVNLRASRGR
ncbi:uncharacterized protein LOC142918268 [Petromyzon marinus]|uniref:uncharacterized protein LOC142918268 n=1 Tax=Petromyzon marinus TaxID=7757 RepID=UPI003F6F3F62